MELSGVLSSLEGVACDGVLADAAQPCGLAYAAALRKVMQDRDDLVVGQACVKEGCGLAFGETLLASATVEQARLLGSVVAAHREIVLAAQAVTGALGILAAELVKVVHGRGPWQRCVMTLPPFYA